MMKKAPRPVVRKAGVLLEWTDADSLAAQKRGWDLFDATSRYELSHIDEMPGGSKFRSDDELLTHLIDTAVNGDSLSAKALIIAMLIDPRWTAADFTNQMSAGLVQVRNWAGKLTTPRSKVDYDPDRR